MTYNRDKWVLVTAVDITKTDVLRGNSKERNQQRNFETLIQSIGMLTQPFYRSAPVFIPSTRTSEYHITELGERHNFTHALFKSLNMWVFTFETEQKGVFGPMDNPYVLYNTLNNVPVISGLDESIVLDPPMFVTEGEYKNMYIRPYQSSL